MHEFLLDNLNKYYSENEIKDIMSGFSCKRKTTFRINNIKSNKDEIESLLNKYGFTYHNPKEYEDCYILDENFVIVDDNKLGIRDLDIYKEGKIYIQNISSMIPVLELEPKEGENILDMCSAPGGKTTMIQSITHNKANVTACELNKIRYEKLKYNIDLQGANVYLLNTDAMSLDDNLKYDKIILDAPCSGSGTLDITNDNYKKYFIKELIDKSIKKQQKLINKASKLLKKSGTLIYSTCSILNCENEDMVSKYKPVDIVKIMPDEIYEGFFVSKIIL